MKVAVVDGIAAHYRKSLFQKLSQQVINSYHLYASRKSLDGIKTIDPVFASLPVSDGGIIWTFIENIVILKRIVWQRGVLKIAAKGNHDVYIFIGESHTISTWLSVLICRLRKKKIAFWGHGSYGNERFFIKCFRTIFNKLPDAYLLYNERAVQILSNEGLPKERLFVVYNSLDHDTHCAIRKSITCEEARSLKYKLFPGCPDFPVLIFIGRLIFSKRIDQLISAVKILHNIDKKVLCVIVGDGKERENLGNLVANFGLQGNIYFYGSSYDEYQNALLISMADCCVAPGNIGLTAIHSMTFGTPVITHNDFYHQGPEASAVIPNRTGDLFNKNDIDDLAEKIVNVVFRNRKEHYSSTCQQIIDKYYNPDIQVTIFNKAIEYLSDLRN